jgi:formylglycine-generating enzyme required for sulfatase activity
MKLSFLSVLLVLSLYMSAKETPEVIPFKTKIIKPGAWYAAQAELWKKSIAIQPSQEGWINYYTAARYAQWPEEALRDIANAAAVYSPNSFESNLLQSWREGYTEIGFESLKKAYALQPANPATYGSMVLYHEFYQQEENRKVFSEKLWLSGQVSSSLLSYSYNVLMSLDKNAILFTEGDNTTLPLFILQDIFSIREDVTVINLDLMLQPVYRDKKLKGAGINTEDLVTLASVADPKKDICALLPAQNANRKFYYSLTLPQQNISSIKDQLYVVGLASQISRERLDNISLIRENLETRFLLDYLTVDFNGESPDAAGKVLQSNYLIPMVLLYEHYQAKGDHEKAKQIENLLIKIAGETGKSDLINNFISREKTTSPFIPYALDVKKLEDAVRIIKDNIYAMESEVTNEAYNNFLKHLVDTKQLDLYERYKIDLSQYTEPTLSFMKSYHAPQLANKKEKYFTQYPIVNISYESAKAYCEWLTEQYNHQAARKYKKVIFRLPSINEWQVSAAGLPKATSWVLGENQAEVKIFEDGKEFSKHFQTKIVSMAEPDILYPWFKAYNYRNKSLNHKGCSLGNFKYPDTQIPCQRSKMNTADGWWLMAQVNSYFPNDVGLYDVVGNVAEMTNEKGKACGGSWNHSPEESTIKSINEYKGPDSAIGFRVFMEVIEK